MQRARVLNRRRSWLAAMALGVSAIVAPTVAPSPAGATPAPLLTEDGLGIRVDEWAIQGPALEAIETALQPTVDSLVQDGAADAQLMDDPDYVISTSNLELAFDILAPTTTRPNGALNFSASIQDIYIEYYRYGEWWQPECWIWVYPDDASISVTANVDPTNLPAAPLDVEPAVATWDDDPNVTVNSWPCNGYLIDEWWEGFVDSFSGGDPTSTASQVEDQIDAMSQDLVDQIWEENVVPVLDSLEAAGITVGQLRTDAYGLIVTADVNATGGLDIPGIADDIDVSAAPDSGADNDVNAVLANYDEIIVTIHPNIANQYLYALGSTFGGSWGQVALDGPTIEALLIPLANQGSYNDSTWNVRLHTLNGSTPYVTPDATTGVPTLRMDDVRYQFRNSSTIVATFNGTFSGASLVTEVRTGLTEWGPATYATGATINVTRTQANTHAALISPQTSAQILPYAQSVWSVFNEGVFIQFATLAPIVLYDLSVTLCTTCGRYTGDERYTETFRVN